MDIYRQKTRSDDVVAPEDLQTGQIVWVGPRGHRQEFICTSPGGECIPLEEYLQRKQERARNNVRKYPPRRVGRRSWSCLL